MSRRRKLTDEQVEYVRSIVVQRRALPTNEELAVELGVSKRCIEMIAAGYTYKVRRESVESLHILLTHGHPNTL